jgi:Na+/melibiose symporter-like transporter
MKNESFRTSGVERWGFALFMAGQAIINAYVTAFLQLYLTDVGIAAVSVGILFLTARVWDAINNPIFGMILDKTNLKTGKFLPWLRISNIMLPLVTVLLFAVPHSMPTGWKLFWAFVAYLLYDIAYTMCDVPAYAMTSAVTDQVQERVNIMSRNSVLSSLTVIAVSILAPQCYSALGPFFTAIILGSVTAVMLSFMSRFAKERYINKDGEKTTLKSMWDYVKDNKYLRISFCGIFVLNITSMTTTVMNYFTVNCLGDIGMTTYIMIYIAIPALVMAAATPLLTKRFDKFHLLIFGIVGSASMSIVCFFAGYENFTVLSVLLIARSIFFGLQLLLQGTFTGDIVEYGEFITGKRLQGTAYSIQTTIFGLMNALPAAAAMFILGMFGFIEGQNAVQTPEVVNLIWILFILSPVVGAALSLPIFAKYKLRDKTVQIMASANSGDMTREEANALIEGRI